MKYALSGAAGALAIGLTTLAAEAAPAGASAVDLRTAAATGVEKASYRRRHCWWHDGHRHCRRYYRDYGPRFSFHTPGFGFYLGDGYRDRSYSYYGRDYRRDRRHRRNKSQY
jgi:hypothetical protein